MKYPWGITSLFIFFLFSIVIAQPAFEVVDLEGTAKTQRVQKHKWEKLSIGAKLSDNDIIETYFQTKISIRLSDGTIVLFGSNSKALLTISTKEISGRKTTDASFSLFNGGIMAKAINRTKISVFTTNAVGEIDSGTLSVVANTKSGETGFLSIGGKSIVRNISQQKGIDLEAGFTTIVIPGRDPAPPLSLSFRHAAILRHYFGDKLITDELKASSITPANDQVGSSRATVTAGTAANANKTRSDMLSYQRRFSIRNIYGSILEDRENTERLYRPVSSPTFSGDTKGSVELRSDIGLSDRSSSLFTLVPQYRLPYIEAGLRFVLGTDFRSEMVTGFNSPAALFDKIEHITAGSVEDSIYLTAGTLSDLTFGNGLLVSHFRNSANNLIYHPFGLNGKANVFDEVRINAFLADVASPSLMGIHAAYEFSSYTFGAGYYYNPNQYLHLNDSLDMRYTRYTSGKVYPDTAAYSGAVSIYEINLATAVADYYNLGLNAILDFAQKRENGINDGYIIRPTLKLDLPFYTFGAGMLIENGRLVSGEFDEFYSSRHAFVKHNDSLDTLLTLNTLLDNKRYVTSLRFIFMANPLKDLDVSMCYTQAFGSKNAYAFRVSDTAPDSVRNAKINTPLDFSFDFKCSVNDRLIPFVKFASVYVRQSHARLYPRAGVFLSSWNSEAGFDCTSKPFFLNLSILLGGRLFYIDKGPDPNDIIDAADRVLELFAGIRWEFL